MNIALISPQTTPFGINQKSNLYWSQLQSKSIFKKNWTGITPSLPLLAALTPCNYTLEIIDENIQTINFDIKYDLVGITSMTQQADRAYEIAQKFKTRNIPVVLGGIHTTVLPEEASSHADSIIVGEAEDQWDKLIGDFNNNKLKPLYKSNKNTEMTASPIPRYDLLRNKNYNVIWIQTSRGCPHDCEFCAASKIYGGKYRKKTLKQVIDELLYIKKYFGDIWIGFADDNLLVNKKFARELVNSIRPLNLRWAAQSDISIAEDEELLISLRKSGCAFLFIGLESVDTDNLLNIDKHNWKYSRINNYSQHIKTIQSYGIGVFASFIVGFDSADKTVFSRIANFIIDNNIYEAIISILTPLPGTRLRDKMETAKRILPVPWSNYTLTDVTFTHPLFSKDELEEGQLWIYKQIHSPEIYLNKMDYFKTIYKKLINKGII